MALLIGARPPSRRRRHLTATAVATAHPSPSPHPPAVCARSAPRGLPPTTPQSADPPPLSTPPPAFVVGALPPPLVLVAAAAAAATAAALSAIALRPFLPRRHPVTRMLRLGHVFRRRVYRSVLRLVDPQRGASSAAPVPASASGAAVGRDGEGEGGGGVSLVERLEAVGARAIAHLEDAGERTAAAATTADDETISDDEYATLTPRQRRDLLRRAFERARADGADGADGADTGVTPAAAGEEPADDWGANDGRPRMAAAGTAAGAGAGVVSGVGASSGGVLKGARFWRELESLNGRAAALGFALCLAREIIEPGHPSLFEQVVDVVVPIAQSTPPFLVAVCDALADLLT